MTPKVSPVGWLARSLARLCVCLGDYDSEGPFVTNDTEGGSGLRLLLLGLGVDSAEGGWSGCLRTSRRGLGGRPSQCIAPLEGKVSGSQQARFEV